MSNEENEYISLPQPSELKQTEKEDAMGAYLMMFASIAIGLPLPIINIVAAVVYYFVNRKKGNFVKFHALQSMLSAILLGIVNAGLFYWTIHCFLNETFTDFYFGYLAFAGIANLAYFVFSIVAAVKARKGQFIYFIFFGKLAYHRVFSKKYIEKAKEEFRNLPPSNF